MIFRSLGVWIIHDHVSSVFWGDDNVTEYVRCTGFFIPSQLRCVRLNWPLLAALIESGGPRNLCFIFEWGRSLLHYKMRRCFRASIDGLPLTKTDDMDLVIECERFNGYGARFDGSEGWSIKFDVAP